MNYHFLYQSKLLETFKALITILESKNLNYFACGGTALGAVRHKNIIPWDDDIDIFMPRKDYMELLGLAQGIKEGYEILSINDHGGRATYMKFVNIQTSYWEIENCPTMSGLFIDIFPLDYYDGDIESFVKKWSQLKNLSRLLFLSNSKFSLSYLIKNIGSEDKKMYWSNLLSLFVPGFLCGFIRERIRQFDKNILYNSKTNTMVCYYGSYGKKEYFEACWFDNYVDCQYADFTIRLPIGFDQYLKCLYGDYMKLPPIEKQKLEHRRHYVNLSERVDIETAKLRIKKGFKEE